MIHDYNTKLYGLIGNPVEKSLSPLMHNNIYKIRNDNSVYLTFKVLEEDLEQAIDGIRSLGIRGVNVTIPHKIEVIRYLDELTDTAKKLGAVNTIKNIDGKLIGHNTDGDGVVNTFRKNNISLRNKNILVLGAGGASYGVVGTILLREDIKKIYILNRTIKNATKLKGYMDSDKIIVLDSIDDLNKKSIDIIINTTSVGMYPNIDEQPILLDGFDDIIVYDAIYKPLETKLILDAKNREFQTFNGIDMLFNQGLICQEFWDEDFFINNEEEQMVENILKTNI